MKMQESLGRGKGFMDKDASDKRGADKESPYYM